MGYIIAIGAYLLLLMIYGMVIAHKKVKTADDMVTGGHRIPFIVLVGTLLATWCGGGGITGSASVVYTGGPWVGLITFAAPPIGIILLYFIAGKVRKSNKVTVPEIMEARYGKAASIISALCVMLAYVGVLATQLKAAADILVLLCSSSGVEISHGVALAICTIIIAVITVGGGLVSVAYSDAVSALLMVGGFFAAIPILMAAASAQGATLPPEKMTITGGMSGWELLGYFLPSLALMLGDQNMLQRFASAKDSDEAKKSNIGMFIGEILVIISIVLIVTQAAKLYPTLETPSNVIFQVAVDYLPLVFGALVMCACMAFIVTTADSYLLSSATNLTNDIYVKYIRRDATDRQKMLVLRLTIVVFSVIAVALTLYFPTVLALQMTAYTMYGAAITPAILFALFSKRVTPAAGLAGILVGGAATIIWTLMGTPGGVQCAIVAVPASVVAILIVSAVTKGSAQRSLEALYQEN
ncbi:sodium:solute symporter family protein [Dysosmobacter sp.]|uniref:sodium:solute symporter family protein n=1 Tax=Dysosmobacter sp. TaxID=2591382 RepID=UPI003AB7D029